MCERVGWWKGIEINKNLCLEIQSNKDNDFINNTLKDYNKTATKAISEKWNLFQFGVKTGFHFKTCKGYGKDAEYMDDLKRRFMNDMINKYESNQVDQFVITTTKGSFNFKLIPLKSLSKSNRIFLCLNLNP